MRLLALVLLVSPLYVWAEITTIDFVRVLNGNLDEALYYYTQNWKPYRVEAKKRGFISTYRLLVRTSEEGDTDLLLLTGYESQEQYRDREKNFAIVMDRGDGEGLKLLNEKQPDEFREVIDGGNYKDQ